MLRLLVLDYCVGPLFTCVTFSRALAFLVYCFVELFAHVILTHCEGLFVSGCLYVIMWNWYIFVHGSCHSLYIIWQNLLYTYFLLPILWFS